MDNGSVKGGCLSSLQFLLQDRGRGGISIHYLFKAPQQAGSDIRNLGQLSQPPSVTGPTGHHNGNYGGCVLENFGRVWYGMVRLVEPSELALVLLGGKWQPSDGCSIFFGVVVQPLVTLGGV